MELAGGADQAPLPGDRRAATPVGANTTIIPLWIKIPYTIFVCVLVPVYWVGRGSANFLWMSDIALFLTLFALWQENRLIASMMAVAVVLPELAWNIDFFVRIAVGKDVFGLNATGYMWDRDIPGLVRTLSLFHVFLPAVLIYAVWRLGYDRRALVAQTALAWIVLPASYFLTDPGRNINWVFGLGPEPQTWMPAPLFLILLMVLLPLLIYLPTHLVLMKLFKKLE